MRTTALSTGAFMIMLPGLALGQPANEEREQRAFYECSDPLPLDNGLFQYAAGQTYFHFNTALAPTGLKALDFIWLEEAPEGYFMAYLVNTSDTVLHARRQDGSLMIIQEAQNEHGAWMPIEYWVHSGCGNSYFSPLVLDPGHYVVVPIRKYSGRMKTMIRLKWNIGDRTLYSGAFEGSIDQSRFKKEKGNVHGILYHGPPSYLDDR